MMKRIEGHRPGRLGATMVALLAACATVVAGCSGAGREAVGDTTFADGRFSFTFNYPIDFHAAKNVRVTASTGESLADVAFGLDSDNWIAISKYAVNRAVTTDNLDQITPEADGVVGQLVGSPVHGAAIDAGGFPALRYDNLAVPKLVHGKSRIVFFFDQKTQYEINCQSTPAKTDRVNAACDLIISTLKPSASSPTGASAAALASKVVSVLDGYEISTAPNATNGPISATQFDKLVGLSGAAASFHLVAAYERDFDSVVSSTSVYVSLFEFSSPAAATGFLPSAATSTNAFDEAPARTNYTAIPGALSVDGTKGDSDGFHDHAVVAVKGTVVLIVDLSTEKAGPAPKLLATVASQQYGRL